MRIFQRERNDERGERDDEIAGDINNSDLGAGFLRGNLGHKAQAIVPVGGAGAQGTERAILDQRDHQDYVRTPAP